ncbi:prohibitin family protein [Deinococcus yavapaiensis]|uniref:SPFH domain-containing protein n=1 Tax=Deinococcus yavapaiensis KR-236 TaxID=694435 RepID=A0A318SIT8_9DEIO|nr:prohibitin family protein [Deinococcus yavapaiensis]PYE51833.1 SPFH domain-containing protein [Deinococcus yavapaiensis KR-236]
MFADLGIVLVVAGIALAIFARIRNLAFGALGWGLAIVGVIVTIVGGSLTVIPAGQVGVVFSALNGVKQRPLSEGIHFVTPIVDNVILYDARLQELTLSRTGEDGTNADESIQARSKEGLGISADVTVQFRLKRDEAAQLHSQLGPRYIITVIRPQVRSKVRDAIGQFNAADIISTQRQAVEARITEELREVLERNHLELDSVLLRELRIPESVAKAIEEKQTAEQQVAVERNRLQQANIAAQRKVVEAEGEAKANVARAEGESKALKLRGEALKANPEIIQLTVAEKLSPGVQTIMLPSNGNYLLDLGALTNRSAVQSSTNGR